MEEIKIKELLLKLKTPLKLDFICTNILKCDGFVCLELLEDLVEQEILEKEDNYYKIRTKNENKS